MADYFESSVKFYAKPKILVNWLMGDVLKYQNANNLKFKILREKMPPENLSDLLKLIDGGTISGKIAKDVLEEMLESGKPAENIVNEKGLKQISGQAEIEDIAKEVIIENKKVADDYLSGKDKALGFLVGQLMKKTKGKANPGLANDILIRLLQER